MVKKKSLIVYVTNNDIDVDPGAGEQTHSVFILFVFVNWWNERTVLVI